ncbi:T9SS type A sorting domain-containing protein [Adhaeribacter terreus]|uniref:T9SS type A sorting domain-containing protein n=1 Tax=Adhaeribacter terreus TaxID=529703 RepID=A0ABW0E4J5_9BACT
MKRPVLFRAFLIAFCLVAGFNLRLAAQTESVTDYQFSAYNGTFTPLPATASVVSLASPFAQAVPIGFTFNFAGANYTTVYVSEQGFISFNPAAKGEYESNLSGNNGPINDPSTSRPLIAPFWDQLRGNLPLSKASTINTGLPGNQIFTFEWLNYRWDGLSTTYVISFQVKLYEATGRIEFHYRQESGTPSNPTASIGLAGTATGPGNFLSLSDTGPSPSVSYLVETDNLSQKPATGQVYAFTPPPVQPVDVRIIALTAPLDSGCYGAGQPVKFLLKNTGSTALNLATTPVTVQATARGANGQNFPPLVLNTGTLAPGATQEVTVATNFNMQAAGMYRFNARASVSGDGNTSNDSMKVAISRTQMPTFLLPQAVNFTSVNGNGSNLPILFPGWKEAGGANAQFTGSTWSYRAGLGTATNNTAYFRMSNGSGSFNSIISPKVVPGASSVLRFKAAITDVNKTTPHATGIAGTNDSVKVMVSTNCGLSFTPLFSFSSTNATSLTNMLSDFQAPLGQYAGQNIILGICAKNGSRVSGPMYDFHIDDIFIGTPPPLDLAVTFFDSPLKTGCYSATEQVSLTLRNNGSNSLNFATTPAAVQVNVSGATSATLAHTLNTGVLTPGATQQLTLPTLLNMLPVGTYDFTAFAKVTGDPDATNDTVYTTRQTDSVYALPQSSSLAGFTGTNLSAIFPGWREASGLIPEGTQSSWQSETGLGGAGNQTIKVQLAMNFFYHWIVGPKVVAGTNTVVRFKAAITHHGGFTPSPSGMANTDDMVQVLVSADCGASFFPIYTFNSQTTAGLSNVLTDYGFSLSQYAGQEIIVAFMATDGTIDNPNNYNFHLDDIFIGDLPPADLGVTAILSPAPAGCYSNAEPVSVTIRNFGTQPVDLSNTPVTVMAQVSGATTATLSAFINTGTLLPADTLVVNLNPGLNMLVAGNYFFKAYTNILQDNNAANDSTTLVRTRYPLASLPQSIDFTGFTDANLSQVFPDWREASGKAPSGTASNWKHAMGLGSAQNTTAKIYLGSVWEKGWLIGPMFTPNHNTRLTFEAAITEWFNLNPDPTGLAGTDDSVKVMISEDCGATFQTLFVFDSASTVNLKDSLTTYSMPLGAYKSKEITIAFFATDGLTDDPSEYAFHLDNIRIEDIMGMKDEITAAPLLVYPNPNQGIFYVNLNGFEKEVTLTLSSLSGQEVIQKTVKAAEKRYAFEIKNLKPGIYVLKAVSENQTRVCRVVVQ